MSQTVQLGSNNIMHCTPQSKATQSMLVGLVSSSRASPISSSSPSSSANLKKDSNIMRPHNNYSYPNTSGSNTPVSTRSSISCESHVSSSSSSVSMPKRSLMKSSMKTSESTQTNLTRRISPPTVRFADPEPLPKSHTWPASIPMGPQQPELYGNIVPNPLLQYKHRRTLSLPSLVSSPGIGYTASTQPYAAPRRLRASRPPEGPNKTSPNPTDNTVFASVLPHVQDPKWFPFPLPCHSSLPTVTQGSRVPSHRSTDSTISTQSAPAVLSTPTPTDSSPLEHYQPCLYPSCISHYTPAHASPIYYLPQGPYSLPRLHGYCPHHATQEMKETNAICKKQWESLRQNAGRKTLGQIAAEFEVFLEGFRQERSLEDAKLVKAQKARVLGAVVGVAQPASSQLRQNSGVGGSGESKATKQEDVMQGCWDSDWDWRYTPRWCMHSSCPSASSYSPYANHLYAFYHTRRPSTFLPLQNLCPTCSKSEVETFEKCVTEKWSGRCGWDEKEWNAWFGDVVRNRDVESEFWLKAQERIVRERGPVRWVEKGGEVEGEETGVLEKKGKRGILSRLFSSMAG